MAITNEDELIRELKKLKRILFKPVVQAFEPQKIFPPANQEEISTAERKLAMPIPDVLKRIYQEVGNGGFGPGYGLIGVGSGAKDDLGNDLVDGYLKRLERDPSEPQWQWPKGLVPFISWGGGTFTNADFAGDGRVSRFHLPTYHETGSLTKALRPEAPSLFSYWTRWIEGEDLSILPS